MLPVESSRTGNVITVRYGNGASVEVECPPKLIGDPIGRFIDWGAVWMQRERRWRLLDAGEFAGELQEMVGRMPAGKRYLEDVEPGWYPIVVRCWRQMKVYEPDVVAVEVKEKLGELRIAVATEDPALRALHGLAIGWARKQSRRTCQLCSGCASPNDDGLRPGRPTRLCPSCRAFLDRSDAAGRDADRKP